MNHVASILQHEKNRATIRKAAEAVLRNLDEIDALSDASKRAPSAEGQRALTNLISSMRVVGSLTTEIRSE